MCVATVSWGLSESPCVAVQPVTWGMVFNNTIAGSGFTHTPGGAEWAEYSVLR